MLNLKLKLKLNLKLKPNLNPNISKVGSGSGREMLYIQIVDSLFEQG